jgi:alpha-1,2-mannosyltransferase
MRYEAWRLHQVSLMNKLPWRIEGLAVAFALVAPTSVVLAHAWAAVFSGVFDVDVTASAARLGHAAIALTLAALCVAIVPAARATAPRAWGAMVAAGAIAAAILSAASSAPGAVFAFVPTLLCTGVGALWLLRALCPRLPEAFDGALARRPVVACAWALLMLLCIGETARMSAFMTNHEMPGASDSMLRRVPDHFCMGAYFYAADLDRQGYTNIYDPVHYPLLTPNLPVNPEPGAPASATTVDNLAPHILDSLQYSPPFLLLPHAFLLLSNDFLHIKTLWFAMSWLALGLAAFFLSRWIGGRTEIVMLLLIPLLLVSGPTSLGLQRGQFHPAVWALAIGAMLAFEQRRNALGGAMLSFAVLSKIFPGVLGIYLIATRRWRAVGWTFAAAAAWVVISLVVIGAPTFAHYIDFQLPRVVSGEMNFFCFERIGCIINNQAPSGLPYKLAALGWLDDPVPAAAVIARLFVLVVVVLAIRAGIRTTARSRDTAATRTARALAWTSLAMLASLMTWLAPGSYAPLGTFFTLMLLAGQVRSRTAALAIALAWIAACQLPTTPPSDFKIVISFITALILLAVNVGVALVTRTQPRASTRAAEE